MRAKPISDEPFSIYGSKGAMSQKSLSTRQRNLKLLIKSPYIQNVHSHGMIIFQILRILPVKLRRALVPGERAGIFGIHQPDILISDYLVRIRRDVRYLPFDALEIGGEQGAFVDHALEFEQFDISPERGASGFIMGFFEALKYSLTLPHARLLTPISS